MLLPRIFRCHTSLPQDAPTQGPLQTVRLKQTATSYARRPAMSAQAKRGRDAAQDDGEHTRRVKERRTEIVVSKVEAQLCAGFNKLHSTQVLLGQAKANIEMVGGLVCRQKEQLQHIVSQLHAARRGPVNNILLTVVAEAAHKKYEMAIYDQIHELSKIEEALDSTHQVIAENNEKRNGPWPPLPPIRARPNQG